MNNPNQFNRRQVVSGLGASLASITILPSLTAQTTTSSTPPRSASELRDPKMKYPAPPFNGQSQPWPGLASKMDPVPDHGEKSYRGSGRVPGPKGPLPGGRLAVG